MRLKALDFEILRGVHSNGRESIPLVRKPVRVATLIDEAAFMQEKLLVHNASVFIEEKFHDWNWSSGQFKYYSRVAASADVLVVYELEKTD